jgi:septal ring factor EnvC (AmiA/AmiB activator)
MSEDVEKMEAVLRRIDTVERNASDLARSHTEMTKVVARESERIDRLEEAHYEAREDRARREEREKTLWNNVDAIRSDIKAIKELNMESVKNDVAEIRDANKRMFWLVAGAIVTGFGGLFFLLVKGGLGV